MTVERFASILNVAFALIALGASGVQAQSWPTQSVRMIVGFAPGGTADILARKLQTPLSARLGQPIVIENRPGASGAIATAEVARASDGHTFALVVSTHASLPAINRKLPYDTLRDIVPISLIGRIPLILVAKLGLPANTLPELVALAKERPGALNYAHPGIGLSHHFAGELLKQRGGINIVPVAYRGAAPALTDVIAGQIDMTFATTPSVRDPVESRLVRALASTGSQRSMPSVPTFAEVGFEGFDVSEWYGIVGPAGTPPGVVARLSAEINHALEDSQLQDWLRANALQRGAATPEGFRDFVAKEIERSKVIAETAKISVE
jgi:tripartite-type tricarboxylate transporter receptor subunit TctC